MKGRVCNSDAGAVLTGVEFNEKARGGLLVEFGEGRQVRRMGWIDDITIVASSVLIGASPAAKRAENGELTKIENILLSINLGEMVELFHYKNSHEYHFAPRGSGHFSIYEREFLLPVLTGSHEGLLKCYSKLKWAQSVVRTN